jgi:transcriptional regulator with XRE-family HTH domain
MRRTMVRRSAEYAVFLRRLREARRRAGFSQSEAAQRLGKPQSFISKCESGERRVDAVELKLFARAYCVPVMFFYEDR